MGINRSFVGVSVNKCQSYTLKGKGINMKDVHLPDDDLGLLGSAGLEPLVFEHAGLSSLHAACYLLCEFFYLHYSYVSA